MRDEAVATKSPIRQAQSEQVYCRMHRDGYGRGGGQSRVMTRPGKKSPLRSLDLVIPRPPQAGAKIKARCGNDGSSSAKPTGAFERLLVVAYTYNSTPDRSHRTGGPNRGSAHLQIGMPRRFRTHSGSRNPKPYRNARSILALPQANRHTEVKRNRGWYRYARAITSDRAARDPGGMTRAG